MRSAGFGLADLQPGGRAWSAVPYSAGQVEAETELEAVAFARWAVRGWLEA